MPIDIPLTAPQREFVLSKAKHPAIIGGLGSGKSRAGTMRAVLRCITGKANQGIFLPSYDLLKLRAMPGVEEDLTMLGIPYKVNLSDFRIEITGYGFIIFRSFSNPERIVSFEIADAIVDEIDTINKEDATKVWRKISERVRQNSPLGNSISAVTTPDHGIAGFVYDRWVARADETTHIIKAPTSSNPYLPDDYIEQIRANYSPKLADVYINGDFVSLSEHNVYSCWNRSSCATERTITPGDRLAIGLDFNIGGCCAVVFIMDGGAMIAADEFVGNDTTDIINMIRSRYTGHQLTVYPDASGRAGRTNASASDIAMIEAAGLQVDAPPKNPFIRDRVNSVNCALASGALSVNVDKCPKLVMAMESQGYTDKGEPEKYDTHPAIDDWVDAMGYAVNRIAPVIRPVAHIPVMFWR